MGLKDLAIPTYRQAGGDFMIWRIYLLDSKTLLMNLS